MRTSIRRSRNIFLTAGLAVACLAASPTTPDTASGTVDTAAPSRSIHFNWPNLTDCDLSIRVEYAQAVDAGCDHPIDRFIDCFNVVPGSPSIVIPGAGTLLKVEVCCGGDCPEDCAIGYDCPSPEVSQLKCCGLVYDVSGAIAPNGDVTLTIAP